jgi:hypothetical protein
MREFTSQAHKLGLEMDMEVGGQQQQHLVSLLT